MNIITNIVTIATENYFKNTQQMVTSLRKICGHSVIIYCDKAEAFNALKQLGNIKIIELPSIIKTGVKRAKFEAYYHAVKKGDFLYLDSDIIFLEDISGILNQKDFTGCFDDLSCVNIENKAFPWKNADLKNEKYINSGIFFAPKKLKDFFERMYKDSLRDDIWNLYILENMLYDNHFLCAYLNLYNINVNYINEYEYNWQGFINANKLQVYRKGNSLYNKNTILRLAHFAGVGNIENYLLEMPAEISSLLCQRALLSSDENPFIRFLSGISKYFDDCVNENCSKSASVFIAELGIAKSVLDEKSPKINFDAIINNCESEITVLDSPPQKCAANKSFHLIINVKNNGSEILSSRYRHPVNLSYHWFGVNGETIVFDNERASLPADIHPGGDVDISVLVTAPDYEGNCNLQFDLVQEGVRWFDAAGLKYEINIEMK